MRHFNRSFLIAATLAVLPLHADDDVRVQAYVPQLNALVQQSPALPAEARARNVASQVRVLLTLDPQGNVVGAEALTGAEMMRQAAVDAVRTWKYRPVLRDGQPVFAYTDAYVRFSDPGQPARPLLNGNDEVVAMRRLQELKNQFPRSAAQEVADLNQDSQASDPLRRFYALGKLAKAALAAGALDKAAAYANELLAAAPDHRQDWNYGNAIHDGNMVLGVVALRQGDMGTARQMLLQAGRTVSSPQNSSFGPNMTLAKELLEKGDRDTVLEYFSLCANFWTRGGSRLAAWEQDVRDGKMPNFGANLVY
jgi:TonB family protein